MYYVLIFPIPEVVTISNIHCNSYSISLSPSNPPQSRYRRKIFSSSGLMRMRLSPLSGDRMVISTMNGFLMVVHDLDLDTLQDDLKGFKPNLYRLMQVRQDDVGGKFETLT